jgi:lipoyl(octanoyl) transferase
MNWFPPAADPDTPVAQFHLLGCVDYSTVLALQQRLVWDTSESQGRRITVLLCEHPEVLTIGRSGSRIHVRLTDQQLARRQLKIRWVGRGGGCVLHAPGQLAVYPIVPLERMGWSVGDYVRRFQRGLVDTLDKLGVHGQTHPGNMGIWGRTGLLAALGIAVRGWVTYHGAFINVSPAMNPFGYIDTAPTGPDTASRGEKTTMSCLLAETGRTATMAKVRAQIVASLAKAFECDRHHLHTGHPLLARLTSRHRDVSTRAS